jgi:Zn-dependent peptidase ImmA (M78 family)/transcriptional regulator with XRE-family HTH domain
MATSMVAPRTVVATDPLVYAGERLRALRVLVGLSQAELATAVKVTQGAISHVESGRRTATTELLDRAAAATGYPRSFFDAVPADLPPLTLRFRRRATARAGDVHRAEQLVEETYRVVWGLVHQQGRYIPPSLPMATDEDLTPDAIETLAQATREVLGLGELGPVRHVTRSLERGGIFVAPLAFNDDEEAGDAESIGHFGVSCWPGQSEPAVVGYFEGGTGDRQRYTLAHELGHLVLHTRRRFVADPEDEANRFAGAFLVPRARAEEFISADITLRDFAGLKAVWGVSIQALIMRCSQLGLIDPARKTSLFKQLAARGWRKVEPVTVHSEQPTLFAKMLESTYGPGIGGYRRAADAVGLPAFTLATLAPLRTA